MRKNPMEIIIYLHQNTSIKKHGQTLKNYYIFKDHQNL